MSVPPQPAANADPSMEDILASIRRILSEDEAPGATPPTPAPTEAPSAAPSAASEVFALDASMLVDESPAPPRAAPAAETFSPPPISPPPPLPPAAPVAAEPPPAQPEPPPAMPQPAEPAPDLAHADLMEFDPPPRSLPPPPPPLPSPLAVASPPLAPSAFGSRPFDADAGLVAPEAAAAAASSMGALVRRLAAERGTAVYRGGPTIEDLVRDEMRPMLKEWLDAHLPAMVERLVRAEIERVVSGSLR